MKILKKALIGFTILLAVVLGVACMLITFPSKAVVDYKNGDVKMIAHRGLSGLHTENTVAAFLGAAKSDYYGIETDVHVTADGQYALFHDDNLKGMTGVDMKIAENEYGEIRSVELPDKGGDGETARYVPLLHEFVKICKDYDKQAIVELKASFTKQQMIEIVDILDGYGMKNKTTFISFDENNLLLLRQVYPTAHAQYLFETATDEAIQFAIENKFDASIQFWRVLPTNVKKIHDAGLQVGCWTVDNKWQAGLMKLYGVDYITSNILV